MKKKGFTLIEVLVVLLIMGFLLSVGVLQYNSSIENSKRVAFQSTVLNALSAAESYRQKYGEYPSTATLNLLFNDTAYFTTKPINPYTSQPLQATTDQSPETSSKLGYFYYNVKPDGSIEVITNPVVDINLASGSLAGGSLPSYTVTFTVKNTSGSVISGAQITIGGRTVSTNTSGTASVTLPQSSYFYSVNKDGYNFYTSNINLTGNMPVTVTLSPKTYTVTIFVMDANTGNPISGATVSGIGSRDTTDPNGKLTLTNVTAKSYSVQVSAVGYENSSKVITVNNNQQVNITLSRASCTITFNITNGANALVQLNDGSVVNLDSNGSESVSKPCGEYSYMISKEGYNALSGNINALSDITIQSVMAKAEDELVEAGEVQIALVYSPIANVFNDFLKNSPNRGIVIRQVSSSSDQITILQIVKTIFSSAKSFSPSEIHVVAIGAGGQNRANGNKGGGSGFRTWDEFTNLPDINEVLTINVTVGATTTGEGQPTTVSIPSYIQTITASGGGHGNNPDGQNDGSRSQYGTGFAASVNGNGTSEAYDYLEALPIWKELVNMQVYDNGIGGGGGQSSTGVQYPAQHGAVFLLIRGVVYY